MQTTWKTFTDITSAISACRGNTQISIGLVKENLFVGETAEWIATASVNDFGDWQDGCVVLTDQRLFVAYVDPSLQQSYGNMIPRIPVPRLSQFQGGGNLTNFAIEGLTYQAIALNPAHFSELSGLLAATDASEFIGQDSMAAPAAPEDPMVALTKAKELLEAGLITQQEFDSKKEEILKRL